MNSNIGETSHDIQMKLLKRQVEMSKRDAEINKSRLEQLFVDQQKNKNAKYKMFVTCSLSELTKYNWNILHCNMIYININFHKTLFDMKEEIMNTIFANYKNIIFHKSVIETMIFSAQSMFDSKLPSYELNNNSKIKELHAPEPNIDCRLRPVISFQIVNKDEIFVFYQDVLLMDAFKFIKKMSGVDVKNLTYNNESIEITGTLIDKFTDSSNIIKLCIAEKKKAVNTKVAKLKENGIIYLIRTREYVTLKQPIYKIGKTSNDIATRLGAYGKGGEVIFTSVVNIVALDVVELELINTFKEKYQQKINIGTEYFEGNCLEMRQDIFNVTSKYLPEIEIEDV